MADVRKMITENKPQITAAVVAIAVLIVGAAVLAQYQGVLKQRSIDQNVSDAKQYLADREQIKKQFTAIDYPQTAKNNQAKAVTIAQDCQKLDAAAKRAQSPKAFKLNDDAKDNETVQQAQAASQRYSLDQAKQDIENLAAVCQRQKMVASFVENINAEAEKLGETSDKIYQKSFELMDAHAKELAKSCPYTYLNVAGQKICDKQVDTMKKYAQANKMVADAIAAGKSPMTVAEPATALFDAADKPLDVAIYKQVLAKNANTETFLPTYAEVITKRVNQL